MANGTSDLRDLEEWLYASVEEAARRLPDLLDLPPGVLRREFAARPELRTAGMMQQLIDLAHGAAERYPRRAHELTSLVLDFAPLITVAADRAVVVVRLQGIAWKEHARALCALGSAEEARRALAAARRLFRQTPVHDWYVATVDLLDAPLVHDEGDAAAALQLARSAAAAFALHHDYEHLVEAKMLEIWMHWSAGEDLAADEAWTWTAALAQRRGHPTLLARLSLSAARLHLRRGNAEAASRMLDKAVRVFDEAGLTSEAIRTRWHLAEALTARGRIADAISEYHILRASLLAIGAVTDAAVAATEAVELLLVAGRDAEVPLVTGSLVDTFRTKLTQNALEAFTYLDARAAAGTLTPPAASAVRRYFEDLPQQPLARFRGAD